MEQVSKSKLREIIDNLKYERYSEIFAIIDQDNLKGDVIEYSYIFDYIKILSGEERDKLHFGANAIKSDKRMKKNCTSVSMKNFKKVLEHVLLEIPRAADYEKINSQLIRNDKLNRSIRKDIRDGKEIMKSHEEKMEKMQGEFISILSIFSAVIIAFFGGINLLGSALSSINNTNKYRLIIVLLIIGLVMFNVIYMLLYSISRLTGKNIGVKRKEKKV